MVFGLVAIASGMIWAKPIWNVWWVWDPASDHDSHHELLYLTYFILRSGLNTMETRARLAAVYAIISVITVPLTFLSIRCSAPFTGCDCLLWQRRFQYEPKDAGGFFRQPGRLHYFPGGPDLESIPLAAIQAKINQGEY